MPTYEYLCESNGRVVEVSHKMTETVKTWGDLCKRANLSPGRTDPKTKVVKLMSAAFVSTGNAPSSAAAGEMSGCNAGGCGGGLCDLQ